MLILNDQLNYLLDPFARALASGVNFALEDYIKQQQLQRRAEQIAGLLSQAFEKMPSSEKTYVLAQASPELQAPELKLGNVESVQEKIGRGLLGYVSPSAQEKIVQGVFGNLSFKPEQNAEEKSGLLGDMFLQLTKEKPKETAFVNVMKNPAEYQMEVYQQMLPILSQAAVYGLNAFPLVNNLINMYAQEYKRAEERGMLAEKLEKYTKLLPKLLPGQVDEESAPLLSYALATGMLKPSDIQKMHEKNAVLKLVKMDDGRVLAVAMSRNTGEVLWTGEFPLNFDEFERKQKIKAQAQAEARNKYKGTTGNKGEKTSFRVVTIRIPTQEILQLQQQLREAEARGDKEVADRIRMEIYRRTVLGNHEQVVNLIYNPKTGDFLTLRKKLPVDVNNPWHVHEMLRLDQELSGGKKPSKPPKSSGDPGSSGDSKTQKNPWKKKELLG